ncbi:MAG: hypothetical protein AB7L41_16700 [Flavobacteriaceae bacterium]
MTGLVILAFILLMAVLVPLVLWLRKRQRAYGPVLAAGGEAEAIAQLVEEQRKLNAKMDTLIEELHRERGAEARE